MNHGDISHTKLANIIFTIKLYSFTVKKKSNYFKTSVKGVKFSIHNTEKSVYWPDNLLWEMSPGYLWFAPESVVACLCVCSVEPASPETRCPTMCHTLGPDSLPRAGAFNSLHTVSFYNLFYKYCIILLFKYDKMHD